MYKSTNDILKTNKGVLSGPEPVAGSVILSQGRTGTAWQRFFSDDLWHSVTGKVLPWVELTMSQPNVVLVYEPDTEISV